ncbi:peptidyl-alpha-hydroxyglycine alpha-amidating lyase family protein [Maribacter algicola]|uniref:Peptidyl-alpha-hydroxyglycine alpha-amidating lyase family protein n=1 Tax=Meishania litoralis TaxID=3434685 RepID=A0ACC7LJ38_9FLAO
MKFKRTFFVYFLTIICLSGCTERKPTQFKDTDTYILVDEWPKLPPELVLGNPTGLGIDSENNIVIFHRAGRVWKEPMPEDKIQENTILTIDKQTGEVRRNWGANLFVMPHGLEIDKEDNIWVTDVALHQVFKFSPEGNLLMTLGVARIAGNDDRHFNLPTDIAVADDGSFYVSDGYGNSRVVKFSKDGTYLFEWGTFGDGHSEFKTPHGIDLDKHGNVYVADRENNRIQKFDAQGNFLALWQNKRSDQLYSVAIDHENSHLFAIDYMTSLFGLIVNGSDIFRFDTDFEPQIQFGRTGHYDGPKSRYHDVLVDDEGSIYVGDILNNKVQKFRLDKGN